MRPDELVQLLRTRPLEAMRALTGGVTSTELRDAWVTPAAFDALVAGTRDPSSRVRWWCVQILDHLDDARAITALVAALDDPVPRVRRNAAHALGCVRCKPSWDGRLPSAAVERLHDMAEHDDNAKVRATAAASLACVT